LKVDMQPKILITIEGDPGSGKTTLLREIAKRLTDIDMIVKVEDDPNEPERTRAMHAGCVQGMRGRTVLIKTVLPKRGDGRESAC
jgi:Mg-chelatase subunit ChlI